MLQNWITLHYLQPKTISQLRTKFSQNKPFPHLELKHFFNPAKIAHIQKTLRKESFELKQADLFQFSQTKDLVGTKYKILNELRTFLSSAEFISYLQKITNCKLKPKVIDMAGTLYQDTDFLLCHDDQLEGRKIAYFIYLSNLEKHDGGKLQLYSEMKQKPAIITKNLLPQFNTFAFFEVSPYSFHRVEEVVTPIQRLALSGWFHAHK